MNQHSITFTQIAELYIQELRRGDVPKLEEYQRAFPQLADDIEKNFPLLRIMEGARLPVGLEAGVSLGDCVVESEIGRGGMGIVYRARDTAADREVALKVLPLDSQGGTSTKRFEHEREAMARLNHPNIVPVYRHGCTDRYAYLVIKLIEGFNLAQLLNNEAGYRGSVFLAQWRNDWHAFAEMAAELASGLHHAHEKGLVHRDVKPANLLLDAEGKIWISDFGLAKLWDSPFSASVTGNVIGTPRYMSPEQSQGVCDARSDIFSLGVTLYELASGERAHPGTSIGSIVRNRDAYIRDIREIAPTVPAELASIIMRACQYDPGQRYQTAYEMQFVLQRFCQGFSKADRRRDDRPSDELYRQRARRNVRRAIAIGGCICLLAMSYPLLMRTRTNQTHPVKSTTIRELETPTQALIDKLAQGKQDDVVQVVSDVLKASINKHSVTQWNYTEKAKQELLQRVAAIQQLFVDNRLGPEHMNQFMFHYRESSLAVAGRLLHLVPQIDQIITDPRQQNLAYSMIRQFSSAIINRAVDKADANRFIDAIVQGRFNSIDEASAIRIPAEELHRWLDALQAKLAKLPPDKLVSHRSIPDELKQMLHDSFDLPAREHR